MSGQNKITRIEGGVTAAEGFEAAAAAAASNIRAVMIWRWYTAECPAGQQEPLPPM